MKTDNSSETDGRSSGYSIRVASRLTGISADKLRIWERRYGFPSPGRTRTGIRTYSETDIERLVLISRAMRAGCRAGDAIAKSPEDLRRFLSDSAQPLSPDVRVSLTTDAFVESLREDDFPALREQLRQAVATLGPRRFIVELATPLVERVGELWHAGVIGVRHEHLFSQAFSTQLRLLLSAHEEPKNGPVILLTTLPGEQHGLGMEMAALYLTLQGAVIRLLGVDTPTAQIIEAALALRSDAVGISISSAADLRFAARELEQILRALPPEVELWVGGRSARSLEARDPRLKYTVEWADLDRALTELGARVR